MGIPRLFKLSVVVDTPLITSGEWDVIVRSSSHVVGLARSLGKPGESLGAVPGCVDVIEFDPAIFGKLLKQSEVLIIGGGDKSLLGGMKINDLPKLRYIGVHATGYEHIPPDLIADSHFHGDNHIIVAHIPKYATSAVVEYAVSGVLSLLRRLEYASFEYCDSDSPAFGSPGGESLADKNVVIFGMGTLGQAFERVMTVFGARVSVVNKTQGHSGWIPFSDREAANQVLSNSHIVSLHLPDINEEVLDESRLRILQPGTIVVNTSRPGLLNEEVLLELVESGSLRAVLDVLEKPNLLPRWRRTVQCGRAIVTHHIAFHTEESLRNKARLFIDNLQSFERALTQGNFNSCSNTVLRSDCEGCFGSA